MENKTLQVGYKRERFGESSSLKIACQALNVLCLVLWLGNTDKSPGTDSATPIHWDPHIPKQRLTLTASGGNAQLVECKIVALDNEKWAQAERVIKKK